MTVEHLHQLLFAAITDPWIFSRRGRHVDLKLISEIAQTVQRVLDKAKLEAMHDDDAH